MNDYIKLVVILSIIVGAVIFIMLITICPDMDWRNCKFDPYRFSRNSRNARNQTINQITNQPTNQNTNEPIIETNLEVEFEVDLEANLINEMPSQ